VKLEQAKSSTYRGSEIEVSGQAAAIGENLGNPHPVGNPKSDFCPGGNISNYIECNEILG
jgi:hypothetical protein